MMAIKQQASYDPASDVLQAPAAGAGDILIPQAHRQLHPLCQSWQYVSNGGCYNSWNPFNWIFHPQGNDNGLIGAERKPSNQRQLGAYPDGGDDHDNHHEVMLAQPPIPPTAAAATSSSSSSSSTGVTTGDALTLSTTTGHQINGAEKKAQPTSTTSTTPMLRGGKQQPSSALSPPLSPAQADDKDVCLCCWDGDC